MKVIRTLLNSRVDPNAQNLLGETPLHIFAARIQDFSPKDMFETDESPRLQAIKILLAAGADANVLNNQGKTALHYVAESNWERGDMSIAFEAARELIVAGVNIDARVETTKPCYGNFIAFELFMLRGCGETVEMLSKASCEEH